MVMAALETLSPPRVVGDMTLLAHLGEGGMATVSLAAVGEGALARLAAVKLLRPDVADRQYRTRFLDEAKVVVRLHHNNLVDVRAAGEADGRLYIAMEAVEGRDLADLWDRCAEAGKAFPVPIAVYIAREVLRGLHYAHTFPGLGLVHRDVSPSNVLIDWAGAVRVADFGLATSTIKVTTTVPGVVFGKVAYMSPEQARGDKVDGRTDVYAVGVILWELLTGRPFRAADGLDTDAAARATAVPPSTHSRRVDTELDAIVVRALQPDAQQRHPSALAMLEALGGWLAKHAPQTDQDALAGFLRMLYGSLIDREHEDRARLLQEFSDQVHSPRSGATSVLVRSTTPEPAPAPTGGDDETIAAGTVIAERYRVLSRLGRGGMGIVYLGEHLTVGRSVAIKVLTREWSGNAHVAERFRAEARAASAAGHPNIVEVFDAGELPDGRLYLVMEFLTGRNLYEEVQAEGPMEVARACHVIRDVARAIRAAHEVGIIHRDLKPDNVMLVDQGRGEGEFVKVLDFGISASAESNRERLTVAGQALGTPEYMAPEQARGEEPTEAFDVYALGVIFYELLTGDPPITGNNMVDIMTRKSVERSPSVGLRRDDLVPGIVGLIDDCLEIDPQRRPRSARLFLSRLAEALRTLPRTPAAIAVIEGESVVAGSLEHDALPSPSMTTGTSEPPPSSLGRVIGLAVIAGLLAAAVIVGGWWVLIGREQANLTAAVPAEQVADQEREPEAEVELAPPPESGAQGEGEAPAETGAGPDAGREPEAETGEPAADDGPPELEPQPSVEPTPAAGQDSASHPSKNAGSNANPKSEACALARKRARDATASSDWRGVLRHTRERKCWESSFEHKKLRVRALKEVEDFERCAKEGKGHPDPKVRGWVKICESRK